MFRILASALILGMFTGCVQTRSPTIRGDATPALWGRIIEADGAEYFRMGDMLFKTRDAKSP